MFTQRPRKSKDKAHEEGQDKQDGKSAVSLLQPSAPRSNSIKSESDLNQNAGSTDTFERFNSLLLSHALLNVCMSDDLQNSRKGSTDSISNEPAAELQTESTPSSELPRMHIDTRLARYEEPNAPDSPNKRRRNSAEDSDTPSSTIKRRCALPDIRVPPSTPKVIDSGSCLAVTQ